MQQHWCGASANLSCLNIPASFHATKSSLNPQCSIFYFWISQINVYFWLVVSRVSGLLVSNPEWKMVVESIANRMISLCPNIAPEYYDGKLNKVTALIPDWRLGLLSKFHLFLWSRPATIRERNKVDVSSKLHNYYNFSMLAKGSTDK